MVGKCGSSIWHGNCSRAHLSNCKQEAKRVNSRRVTLEFKISKSLCSDILPPARTHVWNDLNRTTNWGTSFQIPKTDVEGHLIQTTTRKQSIPLCQAVHVLGTQTHIYATSPLPTELYSWYHSNFLHLCGTVTTTIACDCCITDMQKGNQIHVV